MKNLSEKQITDQIVQEFARELRQRLGNRIQKIILYGSRARGDYFEGSDFDFVVVVDQKDKDLEEQILDVQVEILDEHERLISAQVLNPDTWQFEQRMPWGMNIKKEGRQL
jgi:predicted nucleotidyltransferase